MLKLDSINAAIAGQAILHDISCAFSGGTVSAIVGPNGAGKSTLLRLAAGLQPPVGGRVTLGGVDFANRCARAKAIAYLPQFQNIAWPLTCRDVVALGRLPHGVSADDAAVIDKALARCGVSAFASRRIDTLSGGERARVFVARLLATQASVLLLDEPVQSLDAAGTLALMQLLRAEANRGTAITIVLHDLNLARQYCDQAILMSAGRVVAQGTPTDIFTPAQLEPIFGVEFDAVAAQIGNVLVPRRQIGAR